MEWIALFVVQAAIIAAVIYLAYRRKKTKPEAVCKKEKSVHNEDDSIKKLRERHLTLPLTELSRPCSLTDIIGQEDGIRALRVALCSANPQHVIIYGPPGVGKTCAARLVLNEAIANDSSPFDQESGFIEMDATCLRFDERAIADPLIGSVHDPIYQGAGALGNSGIPQPKPGAVTRAHCGVLFLDEIGELHSAQLNKLLKVLEDRCVHVESSYYAKGNKDIPEYIHDIFENGLPADFRLIGATTRMPEEIPAALRSRCIEIFFRRLTADELITISKNAVSRMGMDIETEALKLCAQYAKNGRDAVNIVQFAAGNAALDGRTRISCNDVEWVFDACRIDKKVSSTIPLCCEAGHAYGLGVSAEQSIGYVMEIECFVMKKIGDKARVDVTGMIEEEEIELRGRKLKRQSTVLASIKNAMLALRHCFGISFEDIDIRINIPGGMPVDGPSAGLTFAVAMYSAVTGKMPDRGAAMTGEITPFGEIRGVGGISEKIEAAYQAGAKCVIVPAGSHYKNNKIKVFEAQTLDEALNRAFSREGGKISPSEPLRVIAAKGREGTDA